MMYLVTGAIGTGKTTWVVDKLIKVDLENQKHIKNGDFDKVREIYSNIDGLRVPHKALPVDWRETPNNSVIAYDEAHKIDIFQPNRKQLHDDERIIQLNESRHTGHEIYFITQSPKFLHQHIRGVISQHFHLHNPMGAKASTVFMWRHGNTTNPDSQAAKNLAETEEIFSFKKEVQENFKSIEDEANHTRKLKIPKKIINICACLLVMVGLCVYLLTRDDTVGNLTGETFVQKTSDDLSNAKQATNDLASLGSEPKQPMDAKTRHLNLACRKAENIEKPECVKWFDDLSKNNGSVSGDTQESTMVVYNPSKPFEQEQIQQNIQYEVTSKPVFSGCMYKNGKYQAYTEQGTLLKDVSASDCQRLIKDGDRPYNYFKKEQEYSANQPKEPEKSKLTPYEYQLYLEYLRQNEQANNIIDPHLVAKMNGANQL